MTLYVIGNGFDLHYGLNTCYTSFKKYLTEVDSDVVERMDDLFDRYNMANQSKDINEWNTLEYMLAVFYELDGDEIYEEALSNAEPDDRADYFDSPSWNVGFYTQYIDILKQEFSNWINDINVVIKPDVFLCQVMRIIFITQGIKHHLNRKLHKHVLVHTKATCIGIT